MEFTVRQQIYYSNKELVPISEIAESLLALESLILQSPEILEAMFPGTHIVSVEVFINELKSDSIWEDIIIKFVFGSQEKFDVFIADLRERVGMDKAMENPRFFSTIIIAMIFAGGAYYLGKDGASTPEQKASIQANNNTIIQIGAGMVDLKAEDFQAILDNAIQDKDKLAKSAVNMVKPAKLDPKATITFNSDPNLLISNEAISAMPREYQEQQEEEFIEDFTDLQLDIRAMDLDSTKNGWKAVAPELYGKRVRLQLDPTVMPHELIGKGTITGNATVIFGKDKNLKRYPKLIFLRSISNKDID